MRSPNYPAISLSEALTLAKKLWDKDKKTIVEPLNAAKTFGYSIMSGPARTKISALRKYGLVLDVEGGIQISPLAMRILHQHSATEDYQKAVREAALNPELFKEIYDTHNEASDDTLSSYLVVKRGFTEDGARLVVKAFRETISLAKLAEPVKVPEECQADTAKGGGNPGQKSNEDREKTVLSNIKPGELPVPIADGMVARVPYPMSEEDFGLLLDTLKLWKNKLVRKLTAIPPAIPLPANAMWEQNDGSHKPVKIVALMGEKDGERYYQSEDGTGIPASQLKF